MTGEQSREQREEAEWLSIVENYGDRAELAEPEQEPEPVVFAAPEHHHQEPAELAEDPWGDEGHYVPPEPPPIPRPTPARMAAWFGLFGVPVLALFCVVVGITLPSELWLLFIAGFVGGFGYLVSTMSRNDPDSGWDDGAVL